MASPLIKYMLSPEALEKLKKPRYLDDSVYAEFDGFNIILTTNNGYDDDPRNKIFMPPEVVIKFTRYLENIANLVKSGE